MDKSIDDECWKQQELRVKSVQRISKGKNALLAMIDDGVGQNIELKGVSIDRWSYLEDSVASKGNHSTFGVTAIAGKTLGIFPNLSILSKQVLDPDTGLGRSREIAAAIRYAADNKISTINLSLGSNDPDRVIESALNYYCSNGINIATIASGNDGPKSNTSDWPANYAEKIEGVLSVAATEIDNSANVKVALFSSRGVVSVGAPGAMLKSMDSNDKLDFIYGTSFSAPIVGATIAVARTLIDRPLYQYEVLDILEKTSKKIDGKENIGSGSIRIVDFLNEVKKLKGTPIPFRKKRGICSRLLSMIGM
jgi:subtilisin family serine protease